MRVAQYFAETLPYWEDIYRRHTVWSTIYQERLWAALRLVDDLPRGPERTALEIGCGPGLGATALARRGYRVHAVDAVPQMVDRTLARARADGLGGRVTGAVGDIHALPIENARFDLVFVIGVSEWLTSLDTPLAEIARVLKPGGHVVISADNRWALASVLDPLKNPAVVPIKRALGVAARLIWRRPRPLRTRAYSAGELDRALRRAGLVRTAGTTLGFGPFSLFNVSVLPDGLGHALGRGLEALARRPGSPLRAAGLALVVAAEKVAGRPDACAGGRER